MLPVRFPNPLRKLDEPDLRCCPPCFSWLPKIIPSQAPGVAVSCTIPFVLRLHCQMPEQLRSLYFFKMFNLNLVVQISGLVSSPGVLEHGVGSMELPIAVSADENSTALSSCHSELLLEEVGSLDAVAMHGGVDLLLVGLPGLLQLFVGLTVFPASAKCRQD